MANIFMKHNKQFKSNEQGFFTYIALLLGTVLVLFWAQMNNEMKIVIQTMHDEVKLTEVHYEAEAQLIVLLQEYKHRGDTMTDEVMTEFSRDNGRVTSYRLLRPLTEQGLGRLIVKVKHEKTGLQAQFVAEFQHKGDEVILKSVKCM